MSNDDVKISVGGKAPSKEDNDRNNNVDDDDSIDPETDLSNPERRIWIVTTAGLPWWTGTAINPLLRALQLTNGRPKHHVSLVIPWLADKELQAKLYGAKKVFDTRQQQEEWIRSYAAEIGAKDEMDNLSIVFYESAYNSVLASLFPREDVCSLIPFDEADIAILEEPEHLNWVRVPPTFDKDDQIDEKHKEIADLGWAAKFNHVVGILHTNYSAYMKQYSYGVSIITASALSTLSSIVVKAYCHRVIRLSDTLPVLDETKEITSNVHGVRTAFLEPLKENKNDDQDNDDFNPAEIYFIGKIAWAKGFDKLLKVEALYKKMTGDYFPIDIYGSGNNEVAIKRGFFGREGITSKKSVEDFLRWQGDPPKDEKAAQVFERKGSLRDDLDSPTLSEDAIDQSESNGEIETASNSNNSEDANALSIIENLSLEAIQTGSATTTAVKKMAKDLLSLGYHVTFCSNPPIESDDEGNDNEDDKDEPVEIGKESKLSKLKRVSSFNFDPPQSLFELRRTPIPARFLGVKDHAVLRDHKIFLNMSTTEVLCTTSAEALAMGKFVILPKHRSNTFFLQFPNCLSFTSEAECVEKIQWARQHDPVPLSQEHSHMLSWEGATERLYRAAAMTKKEVRQRKETGSGLNIARYHIQSNKKGTLIQRMVLGPK